MAVEQGINVPINLGSGDGVSIKDIVSRIVEHLPDDRKVVWDTSKPSGDALRLMDMTKAEELMNFKAEIGLSEGIKETMEWYQNNKKTAEDRYNVFTDEVSTKGVTSA